ncbi:DNA cytosine methyltransferase [Corynebacterium flavescens]|uniref:Cytosine-specific methyltransferase n=1 Tax=Corynebacterium flavescens TaxID=28028 RepID=A0A1L7CNH3_CORFL|nr:DNA (cytosine-5-)-methyltransferase [Corynebacterium flavescens]APT87394.1 hypothetical protein CFLV_09525 [Corynebacterium flavescens]GEB97758.1 hypothetical protein CFL01nite_12530 [Corynebacterium flavescens]
MTLTIGSIFSGYGGIDLAVEQIMGAKPAWFCEWDDAPSKILAHHWPAVPNFRDVTTMDWGQVPKVDIITGGYPCQPFSQAGHRKGTHDDRHLWPHVLTAIRILRPRFAFLENVAGHLTLGFDSVLADLAEIGWDAQWATLRASEVGAPHHRERLFILAYPNGERPQAERFASRPEAEVAGDHYRDIALAGVGGDAIEYEIHCRWGDTAERILAWALIHGAPPPVTEDVVTGYVDKEIFGSRFPETKPLLNPAFAEWMMGLPAGWVTEVPGLTRQQQLKAIGNGVCPPQGAAALQQLLKEGQE